MKILLFIGILVLSLVCVQAATVDELEQRVSDLESQVTLLLSWLSFYENSNVCTAVQNGCSVTNECTVNTDCGENGLVGEPYCLGDDVYQTYRTHLCGSNSCTVAESPQMAQDCVESCTSGQCDAVQSGDQTVTFRTNVENGDYYSCTSRTNCWIAVYFTNDTTLDVMGFRSKSSRCSDGTQVGQTPEGYPIINYGSSEQLGICAEGKFIRFSISRQPTNATVDAVPTEPFTSNNQEVSVVGDFLVNLGLEGGSTGSSGTIGQIIL